MDYRTRCLLLGVVVSLLTDGVLAGLDSVPTSRSHEANIARVAATSGLTPKVSPLMAESDYYCKTGLGGSQRCLRMTAESNPLSPRVIISIVTGLLFTALVIVSCWCNSCRRRRRSRETERRAMVVYRVPMPIPVPVEVPNPPVLPSAHPGVQRYYYPPQVFTPASAAGCQDGVLYNVASNPSAPPPYTSDS